MRTFFLLPVALAVLSSCTTIQPSADQARAQVEKASEQFWAARASGDAAAFASQFTEDGSFMVPGLLDAAGRAAVRDLAQKRFASSQITDLKIDRREIHVAGDTAHEVAWFSEIMRPKNDSPMRMHGRYLLVWQRGTDGAWRVHRYLYSFSAADPA